MLWILLLIAAPAAVPANPDPGHVPAGHYSVEPQHTRVQFTVSHMGFTDWYGDFSNVSGTLELDPAHPEAARVDIAIPAASVSTTNAKLDEELRSADWLDAARYPTIRLTSRRVILTGPGQARIEGDLTLHGVTRPVAQRALQRRGHRPHRAPLCRRLQRDGDDPPFRLRRRQLRAAGRRRIGDPDQRGFREEVIARASVR